MISKAKGGPGQGTIHLATQGNDRRLQAMILLLVGGNGATAKVFWRKAWRVIIPGYFHVNMRKYPYVYVWDAE